MTAKQSICLCVTPKQGATNAETHFFLGAERILLLSASQCHVQKITFNNINLLSPEEPHLHSIPKTYLAYPLLRRRILKPYKPRQLSTEPHQTPKDVLVR